MIPEPDIEFIYEFTKRAFNRYDNMNNYKINGLNIDCSKTVITKIESNFYENNYRFHIKGYHDTSPLIPCFCRCEVRMKSKSFNGDFTMFKSRMMYLSYYILIGGCKFDSQCVINHPLIRALLFDKNRADDFNDYFTIDDENEDYVFNFPLLLDVFTCGAGSYFPLYHDVYIELHDENRPFQEGDFHTHLFVTYGQSDFRMFDHDERREKKCRYYMSDTVPFTFEKDVTLSFPVLWGSSSGLFFAFVDLDTNKIIYNQDFLSTVSLTLRFDIETLPPWFIKPVEFKYTFSSEQIHGRCNKFQPIRWKSDNQNLCMDSPLTILSSTGLPKEVWVRIIQFLPCVVDWKHLFCTCKSLYGLSKQPEIRRHIMRLPGWYCIPFNDDDEYDESPKGKTINLCHLEKVALSFEFSNSSIVVQELHKKRLGLIVVSSVFNVSMYVSNMMGYAFSR